MMSRGCCFQMYGKSFVLSVIFAMSLDQVNNAIQILSTHSGRDRLAKLLHYAPRILKFYFEKQNRPEKAQQAEKFRQAIGNSRRVQRFFSFLYSIPSIYTALFDKQNREPDIVFRYLILFADLCDTLYYISDNLTWMAQFGIVKLSPKAEDFWFVLQTIKLSP
jgi:hypothetical protein